MMARYRINSSCRIYVNEYASKETVVQQLVEADAACAEIYKKAVTVLEKEGVEAQLAELKPQTYQRKAVKVSSITKSEIRNMLQSQAEVMFRRPLSEISSEKVEEFIHSNFHSIFTQTQDYRVQLEEFNEKLQDSVEKTKNADYLQAYHAKIKDLEDALRGPTAKVEKSIQSDILPTIVLPFDVEVKYDYSQKYSHINVDLEFPFDCSFPIHEKKGAYTDLGNPSVKAKTRKDRNRILSFAKLGAIYYIASKLFEVSFNIRIIRIAAWTPNCAAGVCWIEFDRTQLVKVQKYGVLSALDILKQFPNIVNFSNSSFELKEIEIDKFRQQIAQKCAIN